MKKIAVIGLGYVGLPLAVEFGKGHKVVGFDIDSSRIQDLKNKFDKTKEITSAEIEAARSLEFTSKVEDLKEVDFYIVTVPTPIDKFKQPDLSPLLKATETVGSVLSQGNIVIYESTVYPGCTEESCVPLLESISGLTYNVDFFCGYSPERINPGDKEHRLVNIKKITAGSTASVAEEIDMLYKTIISAGTFMASSIKVAEAAKVIENSQRDLNIAFVNELSMIFDKLDIDTLEVLEAAGTKWNFLPFKPGLVGGHCIGVDPYYLTHKAEENGYHPQVLLAGRRINDSMGVAVVNQIIKLIVKKGLVVRNVRVLVLGITFKENCPDIRNTKVVDVINELISFGLQVDVYDPQADPKEVEIAYGIKLIKEPREKYQCQVLAVSHIEFMDFKFQEFADDPCVIYDLKGIWPRKIVDKRL
ncbi:MAG: nucleotide sugar dehydrogenase [Cyclobacteriaceae bacterium]